MNKPFWKHFLSVTLFGLNGVVASFILLSSYEIVFFRTLLGSLLMAFVFFLRREKFTFLQHKKQFFFLMLSGLIMGVHWMFLYEAYARVGPGLGTLLCYCGPVIVVALSPLVFKEKLTLPKLIGFAAVMLGVFCISGISGAKMDPLGFISGILSAVTYAGMVIFNKKAKDIGGLENTMFQLGFAFMAVSVFLLIRQGFSIPVKGSDVLPILGLGLVHTGFGCWLYFSTMSKLPVQTVSILGYLEPLFAVLFSALLLSRPMLPLQWLGAGLIIGGAMIAECWHIFCKKTKT
ncbi:MAG: EamA family transporter [Clostridia bacterium]|mgnify:CR=1 FL=1|nr:EamA family transporter [Clostridia bacterium]